MNGVDRPAVHKVRHRSARWRLLSLVRTPLNGVVRELRVLSPTGILGYGFPEESLQLGLQRKPHVIAVDGGSTDGGPYYLGIEPSLGGGNGQANAFNEMLSADLPPLLLAATQANIPLIIGSAGFAGADLHLAGTVGLVRQIADAHDLHFKLGIIRAEVEKSYVQAKLAEGLVEPLGPAPELTEAGIDDSVRVVAQMGVEPFVHALELGAQVIVAGRANDPSMFAALAIKEGYDRGLALHMAKILECGAIAADPGSGSDALLGTLREDHFLLEPLNPERRCTVQSVAAHSLYEKSHPLKLFGPGGHVDLSDARFEQVNDRTVRVSGSRYVEAPRYQLKLEGVRRCGFRCISVAGVRDPVAIREIDTLIAAAREAVDARYPDANHRLEIRRYGKDGVMGALEPNREHVPLELGLVIEVVADSQGLATSICGLARSVMLHAGFPGRVSTAGNLATPFSPLDIPAGPVYAFHIYHLVDEPDPMRLFPVDVMEV